MAGYNGYGRSYGYGRNSGGYGGFYSYGGSYGGRSTRPARKHSGARFVVASKGSYAGSTVVVGWNKRNGAFLTLFAGPYKGSHEVKSRTGHRWVNYNSTCYG